MSATNSVSSVMPQELVSIITPSYNSADYLANAIESVIGQSYPHWELLIIDDKSTDNSVEIAESYAQKDSRVKVLALKEHGGAAIARNAGIREAKGRYIGFLDSDDAFDREKLALQLDFMWRNQYVLTHTNFAIIEDGVGRRVDTIKPPSVLTYRDMLKANQIGCLTAIYDAAQIGKVYMPIIEKRQDYGLWLRILKGGASAYCLPQVLSYYRLRQHSISRKKIVLLQYNWRLLREVEGFGPFVSAYYLGWHVANGLKRAAHTWLALSERGRIK